MLPRPLTQALAIGFLSVMEGEKRIKLKTVILRTNWILFSQCLEVYIFSLPFLFLYFRTRASINEIPAPILCFVII